MVSLAPTCLFYIALDKWDFDFGMGLGKDAAPILGLFCLIAQLTGIFVGRAKEVLEQRNQRMDYWCSALNMFAYGLLGMVVITFAFFLVLIPSSMLIRFGP